MENAEKPQPIGKKKPNPWGLYDIHGNVAEWCLDHYVPGVYKQFPTDKPVLGPVVLPDAREYPYVARGGSWDDDADMLRSAARRARTPNGAFRTRSGPRASGGTPTPLSLASGSSGR